MDDYLMNLAPTDTELANNEEPLFSGIPSYMVAADTHAVANNQGSILDPTTWDDRAASIAKFSLAATARAVTSTWNIVPTVGNWFGGEFEKLETEDVLRTFDDNLGDYYVNNRAGIDIVGDVAASIIPGMAGIKVLNWGQKALALASKGKAGLNMAYQFGTLPDKSALFAKAAAQQMAQSTAQFSWINGNVIKSLASGYGQAALEGAAFEIAAATALSSSPLFENHDVSDVLYNALLGGGLVGGAIMGSLTAATTYGTIKQTIKGIDRALNPVRAVSELGTAAHPSERILAYSDDLHTTLTKPAEVTEDAWQRTLQRREMVLNNSIRDSVQNMTKDSTIGNLFADTIYKLDPDQMYVNIMGLDKIGRVGDDLTTKLDDAQRAALKQDLLRSGAKETDKDFAQKLARYEKQAQAVNSSNKFLRIYGEDAGTVFQELPETALAFADKFKSGDEVLGAVKGMRFSSLDNWDVTKVAAQEAEARYIWARDISLKPDDVIRIDDIPLLERAYELNLPSINLRHADGTIENRAFNSSEMLNLIENQKVSLAQKMLDEATTLSLDPTAAKISTAEIAKKLNVSVKYLEGELNTADRASDLFAMQSAAQKYTDQQISKGLWKADKGLIKTWLMPQHLQLSYSPKLLEDVDGFILDAASYLKGRRKVYEQSMNNVHADYLSLYNPERVAQFPEISDKDLLKADRFGSAPGMFTASNANYGSLGSKMQAIGNATHQVLEDIRTQVTNAFGSHAMKIAQNQDAALELATIRQQVLQTPEKYVFRDGQLVNIKQARYEDELQAFQQGAKKTAPKQPVFEDQMAPKVIPIKTTEVADFVQDWIAHNDSRYLTPKMTLRNQQGLPVQDLRGTLYFPGVNPKDFKFHAFVVDPSVTSTGATRMIWARSQNELEQLAAKVPPEFNVIYKADTEEYFKALRQYDYDLGINQNYIDSALKRTGVAAPFFPQTDGVKLAQELIQWRIDADSYLARDVIAGKYSAQFMALEKMDQQFTAAGTSKAQGRIASLRDKVSSPFKSYINTALDIKNSDAHPLWTGVNNMVERAFSSLSSNIEDIWTRQKDDKQLEEISQTFEKAGIRMFNYDATLDLLVNHTAPKPVLSNFIRKMNGIVSTFMLRADPLNAINNGIGANVLLGSETTSLVRAIKQGNTDAAGELANLAYVKIPGVDASEMLSPTKLVANAYNNYFRNIMGDMDAGQLKKFYQDNGWLTSISDQIRDTFDSLALRGNESVSDLTKRIGKASELAKKLGDKAEKWTGNKFAEEMNRFVAADVARQISEIGVKYELISPADQLSYINTFINRTQGNFLASQRPALFQGPVGQAVGLFQTYQFNMLQQIFRHLSEGSKKDAAILLALQGSIYGMNGLPAFNAINQYVVGQASGNTTNRDIISTTYDIAGKEAGDWLVYGFASNMFLHPDLKVNLYSRGDINPRQVTVVPTNVADIPIVGFTTKFFGSLKEVASKLGNGADLWPTLMQGIEHAGISRPLAGLAQVAEAFGSPNGKSYSTSTKGDIVMQNDLFSLANLARLVGGRPLDEAIARDAVFRVQSYQSATNRKLNQLGEAVKTTIQAGGTPSQEQIEQFMEQYVAAGGKQKNFSAWMHRLIMNTNKSQANVIADKLSSPHSQYMQTIMGGYRLEDAFNTPE